MQKRMNEFVNLLRADNLDGLIGYINSALLNGNAEEIRKFIVFGRNSSGNIYQFAIAHNSAELVEILEENELLPKSYLSPVQDLAKNAVWVKNYHFFRKSMQNVSVRNAVCKNELLDYVLKNSDSFMARVLFNYISFDSINSCYVVGDRDIKAYPVNPYPEHMLVKKFHENLFLMFQSSRYDTESNIHNLPSDCIKNFHRQAF